MAHFYKNKKEFMTTLNYASCNEDWRSEWEALKITPDDKILCITGSGDRPLNLLAKGPGKIITIDLNPVQNHLLRLKMAAMKELAYDEYSSFLGLNNGEGRLKNWKRIRHTLPGETMAFWDGYADTLEKGIIYQGRWERYLRKLALIAKIMRGPTIRKLFEFDDVEEQRRFIEKRWDRLWWRLMFNVFGSAAFSRIFFGDPGFYQFVSKDMNLGKYIFEGMKQYLENYLARESFMLSLMFRGGLDKYDLPPYLDRDWVQKIIKRMDKVEIITDNILEFMESIEEDSFNKFSLSDVPSFLNREMFERLLDGIVRSGAHGARFCIRQFLTDHVIPDRFQNALVREPTLEDRLSKQDRSFAYRFIVGHVKKGG